MARRSPPPDRPSPQEEHPASEGHPPLEGRRKAPAARQAAAASAPGAGSRRKFAIPSELLEAKEKLLQQLGGLGACIQARVLGENRAGDPLGLGNICAVYIGHKVREDHHTGELAVKVLVRRKASDPSRVEELARIPPFIQVRGKRVPTDVEAVGPIAAQKFTAPEDPIHPGTSIGPEKKGPTGTLGCLVLVRKPDGSARIPCILSNAHVMAMTGDGVFFPKDQVAARGGPGQEILHPGAADPGKGTDIATLWDYEELTLSQSNDTKVVPTSFVDAAVAQTETPGTDMFPFSPKHHTYELEPDPIIDDSLDQLHSDLFQLSVMKEGRETEQTFGTINGVHVDIAVGYGESPPGSAPFAHFRNALIIKGQGGQTFSKGGDSGSLIVHATNHRPIALLVGGDGTITIANPIGDVIDALKIVTFLNSENIKDL